MVRYSEEIKKKVENAYLIDHLAISKISAKFKVEKKTLYRWKKIGEWDLHIAEQAKIMYLDEQMKLVTIAKKLGKSLKQITLWKKENKWEEEMKLFGNIALSRAVHKMYLETVKNAVSDKTLTDPATTDKLSKLLKLVENLNPKRIMLGNIFQLLQDLTIAVIKIGDDQFSSNFQKYLPDMADLLREKYE